MEWTNLGGPHITDNVLQHTNAEGVFAHTTASGQWVIANNVFDDLNEAANPAPNTSALHLGLGTTGQFVVTGNIIKDSRQVSGGITSSIDLENVAALCQGNVCAANNPKILT